MSIQLPRTLVLLSLTFNLAMAAPVHASDLTPQQQAELRKDFKNLNLQKRFDEAQYVLRVRPYTPPSGLTMGPAVTATAKAGNSDVENLAMSLSARRHWGQLRPRVGLLTAHYSVALFEVIGKYKTPAEHGDGRALVKPTNIMTPAASPKEVIAVSVLRTNEGNDGFSSLIQPELLVFANIINLPPLVTSQRDDFHEVRSYLAMQSATSQPMPQHVLTGDTVLINTLPDPTEIGVQALFKQTGHPLLDNLSASLRLPQAYRGGPTWLNVGQSPMLNHLERGIVVDPKDCRKVTVYRYLDKAHQLSASSEVQTYHFIPKDHKQDAAMPPPQPIQFQTVIVPSTTANGIPFFSSIDVAHLNLPECGWIQLNVTKNGKPAIEPYWYRTQTQ